DSDERVVIVFPIYARGDYETGAVKDTVPEVVKQYIAANRDKIFAALDSGNRTFGAKYAYVDPEELDGIPLLHAFELSGTKMDAMTARELLHLESKAAKKEEVTNEKNYRRSSSPGLRRLYYRRCRTGSCQLLVW